jgi:4-aminobutyrate aminotransferase
MASLSPLLKQATPVRAVRGEGAYLYDDQGRRYLDYTSGIGVTSTGHCHPRVVEAAQKQAGELVHGQYTTVMHPRLPELVEKLGQVMPDGIDSFFFASAGTEAVEAALRLVRHATGRPNVIVMQGGFHGRTMGSLSLTTSKTPLRAGLQPIMAGVYPTPFPYPLRYGWSDYETSDFCLRELDYLLATQTAPSETAAIFVEPILGEGGYVPATMSFMRGLRERCDRHGMLLVADEIQTGVGRTGRFWGHAHFDVKPDIVITAKGLASGFPLSAFGASEELMSKGWPGSQGGTYGGNAVSCAAALATLAVIEEEGLVENARRRGDELIEGLTAVAEHPSIAEVRGKGLMVGVEFANNGTPDGEAAAKVQARAAELGLLLLTCGPYGQVVRVIPPLITTREQVADGVNMFAQAVREAAAA